LLVWISLRWFGIDFTDFRMGREEKREKKQKKGMRKDEVKAEKKEDRKIKEEDKEKGEADATSAKKAWSEQLIWRCKKTTLAREGAEEA
jgi:hypothetical protein